MNEINEKLKQSCQEAVEAMQKLNSEELSEIQSKLDKSCKKVFEFVVSLAKCKNCQEEVSNNHRECPGCSTPVGDANIFKQTLRKNGRI